MKTIEISNFPPLDHVCDEAINMLSTNLFSSGDDIRSIMFTSRYEQEGKSGIVMNVMRTLSGYGKRVVLVDAALRGSILPHRYHFIYNDRDTVGLSEYLAEKCPLYNTIYETNLPNAFLIPAGIEAMNSMQLLTSPRFTHMLEYLKKEFDVVLVNAPPVGLLIDAVEIASHCDGAVLVIASNIGNKQDISEAVADISKTGCKVLGAVMNNVNMKSFMNRRFYYRSGHYAAFYHYYKKHKSRKRARY